MGLFIDKPEQGRLVSSRLVSCYCLELATAASRRRQRVGPIAGRSADQRCWVGAALVRASQWIKRRNAPLNRWSFNAACLGKTPYLLSSTGATDHTIESGHAATPPTP